MNREPSRPSIGTIAESFDNALAEPTNGLYKALCAFGPDVPRPWDDVDELELAMLSWVHWFNANRAPTMATSRPTSSKQRSMLHNRPPLPGLETKSPSLHQSQGRSLFPRRPVAVVFAVGTVRLPPRPMADDQPPNPNNEPDERGDAACTPDQGVVDNSVKPSGDRRSG